LTYVFSESLNPPLILSSIENIFGTNFYLLLPDLFERTIALKPDSPRAHLALAHALLMKGDYRSGWAEYEWRYRLKSTESLLPKLRQAQWNGMVLQDSTLMVICEQGYGDCFQYARYLKLAKARVK
jgi:hypothetical protein